MWVKLESESLEKTSRQREISPPHTLPFFSIWWILPKEIHPLMWVCPMSTSIHRHWTCLVSCEVCIIITSDRMNWWHHREPVSHTNRGCWLQFCGICKLLSHQLCSVRGSEWQCNVGRGNQLRSLSCRCSFLAQQAALNDFAYIQGNIGFCQKVGLLTM